MKTYANKAKEETGKAPDCTGAKLAIKKITRGTVKSQQSDYFGCAQYTIQLQILEPKAAAGMTVWDRIRVGTPDDKEALQASTWDVSEGGPARIRRLLSRSGTEITADDEEWMADAVDRTVVAPITSRGEFTNVGLYFREVDKDCPAIGLASAAKAGAAVKRVARPVEDLEDDADEAPVAKKTKAAPVVEDVDDEDDDDDEDEAPAAPAKKRGRPAKKVVDEDEDDD